MDVNATRTEQINLTCCIKGFPIPVIEWYHNNSLVTPNEENLTESLFIPDQTLTTCSILVDFSADLSDSGQYTCKGSNIAGNMTSMPPAFVLVQGR